MPLYSRMAPADEHSSPDRDSAPPSEPESSDLNAAVEPPLIELEEEEDRGTEGDGIDPMQLRRFECLACSYTYEPLKGDPQSNIPAGNPFEALPSSWRCPVCGASRRQFQDVGPAGAPSGFTENLGYGLGVNTLTPGQKNLLIFGALAVAFAFFMSLYLLQ
jgi:rubredoxin